jgi:hypothetical protein
MSGRPELLPQDGTAWLLAIGRRLRAEYAALEEPVPERLAALPGAGSAAKPSRSSLAASFAFSSASTPAAFGKLIADDTEKWAKVIRADNIKPE